MLELDTLVVNFSAKLRWLISKDIEVVIRLFPGLAHIEADPGQLGRVLMNLALNAREAMPHGGQLTIETANVMLDGVYAQTHLRVRPGHYVRLTVQDTGCGMDTQTQDHVFEPFCATKAPGQATGLGLSIVYESVTQSGGHICVSSVPSQGITLAIDLPRIEALLSALPADLPQNSPPRGAETIGRIEDEDSVRSVPREVLQMAGHTVVEAASREEALQQAAQSVPEPFTCCSPM